MNAMLGQILEGESPQKSADYYAIIGCDETANEDQIQTEYKKRALELHPDKQGAEQGASCSEAFQQLQEARAVLLDSELRAKYDRWRRSGLSVPFRQYANIKNTSLHWVTRATKELSVTDATGTVTGSSPAATAAAGAATSAVFRGVGAAAGPRRQTLTCGETQLSAWRAQQQQKGQSQNSDRKGEEARSNESAPHPSGTADDLLRKFRNYEI